METTTINHATAETAASATGGRLGRRLGSGVDLYVQAMESRQTMAKSCELFTQLARGEANRSGAHSSRPPNRLNAVPFDAEGPSEA